MPSPSFVKPQNLSYWTKLQDPNFEKIFWNVPEQKTASALILGGNSGAFATEIRSAEFLNSLPLKTVRLIFPDALRGKLPILPNVDYAPSTDSGSFAPSRSLNELLTSSDGLLLSGDFSKNSATAIAITDALKHLASPEQLVLLSRDTIDLLTPNIAELLNQPRLILVTSMLQLQKVFRSILYPKMLMLSQPLFPVVETLHKFTLSYPTTILTFQQEHIIIAHAGQIITYPIAQTDYSPLSLWAGTLACKILALNLWNPSQPLDATTAALFWKPRF